MDMEFIPLHFGNQLRVVNPRGTIGMVTLWSRIDYVYRRLEAAGVDLDPGSSSIAVLGTLYGNGLRELLRNLLYNPQLDTLLLFGRNRSNSAQELRAFFAEGLDLLDGQPLEYEVPSGYGTPRSGRIRGTSRIVDDMVRPEHFQRIPAVLRVGEPQEPESIPRLQEFLSRYRPSPAPIPSRMIVPLPAVRVSCFPSNPRGHSICEPDPLIAWQELIHRICRFGQPVQLAKGGRRELQNVKVVVERPQERDSLLRYLGEAGHTLEMVRRYEEDILSQGKHPDETYNYGHRMRAYFELDSLSAVVRRLREDPEDRKSYVVLWDPRRDLTSEKGHPCLVSLFFRKFQDRLTLTGTFRTHNALDAWLFNFCGLGAIQKMVSGQIGLDCGAITVFSHSITIDAAQMDRASMIANKRHCRYSEDPMGYFRISLDEDAILVEHRHGDITLRTYRQRKASVLQHEIARDGAVSDLNHALYLGRQLARAEVCLARGEEFIQE